MQGANFTGQPIFCQILALIPNWLLPRLIRDCHSDHYYKHFKSEAHLVTMLFTAFTGCRSIREVVTGMQAWAKRLFHLGLKVVPRRSTLSDANCKRPEAFFAAIFRALYKHYFSDLPDSRKKDNHFSRLFMIDSTTISPFQELLAVAGRPPQNGKRKGGVKAHVLVKAEEDFPCLVDQTKGSQSDKKFLKQVAHPKGSILVFDKGYADYSQWKRFGEDGFFWITRQNKGAAVQIIRQRPVHEKERGLGILEDADILLGTGINKGTPQINAR